MLIADEAVCEISRNMAERSGFGGEQAKRALAMPMAIRVIDARLLTGVPRATGMRSGGERLDRLFHEPQRGGAAERVDMEGETTNRPGPSREATESG